MLLKFRDTIAENGKTIKPKHSTNRRRNNMFKYFLVIESIHSQCLKYVYNDLETALEKYEQCCKESKYVTLQVVTLDGRTYALKSSW